MTYLNDWFFIPFFMFGWLPIIVYSKIKSIPEYFEKRFSPSARFLATILLLLYMIGYIGIGFLTLGKAVIPMLPEAFTVLGMTLPITLMGAIIVIVVITGVYITFGGQTAVIFTDLLQGFILLFAGFLLFFFGITYLGGFDVFWNLLPTEWKLPLADFNQPANFNFVGIFWQDGLANSIMFGFLHQGTIMRYMSARSFKDCKKAVVTHLVVLMPLAACVVGGAGWLAKALANHGDLPADLPAGESFYAATQLISQPGIFGLILAAMIAALMSTVDTLITAISAVWVNDVHKLYIKKDMTDRQALTVARLTAIGATVVGIILVPVFMNFDSIYDAHGAFTAAVTPPLVVTFIFSVFWKRFTAPAALATLVVGLVAIAFSFFVPEVITPFAHGVPMGEAGDGLFSGVKQYKFMRACYGLTICAVVGVVVSFFTRPETKSLTGLVWEKSFYRSLKTD
jgi:SSS family solute:Na+ symporter